VAVVEFTERQLTLKLVYYGPPRSGKTTNLRAIHARVDRLNRGRLVTLDTRDDRTLFFDLLPVFFQASGWAFRVKVYTVPGQPMHEATRRLVLQAADGIVFVADSSADQVAANTESYANMMRNLPLVGLDPDRVPIVVQYNKRDLPDRIDDAEMRGFDRVERPLIPAVARGGDGVAETFLAIVEAAWQSVDRDVHFQRAAGVSTAEIMRIMRGHLGFGDGAAP
jgi:signal recognition particle receptor subunit beta